MGFCANAEIGIVGNSFANCLFCDQLILNRLISWILSLHKLILFQLWQFFQSILDLIEFKLSWNFVEESFNISPYFEIGRFLFLNLLSFWCSNTRSVKNVIKKIVSISTLYDKIYTAELIRNDVQFISISNIDIIIYIILHNVLFW